MTYCSIVLILKNFLNWRDFGEKKPQVITCGWRKMGKAYQKLKICLKIRQPFNKCNEILWNVSMLYILRPINTFNGNITCAFLSNTNSFGSTIR